MANALQSLIEHIGANRDVLGGDLCALSKPDRCDIMSSPHYIGKDGGPGILVNMYGQLLATYDAQGVETRVDG